MCTGSEARCTDRSCSVDGACSLESITRTPGLVVNEPPRLELLPVPVASSNGVVEVPRGWMYSLCSPGVRGTSEQPCEPGVDLHHLNNPALSQLT